MEPLDGIVMPHVPTARDVPVCPPHHWRIETPQFTEEQAADPTFDRSLGSYCKKCGATKRFRNVLPDDEVVPFNDTPLNRRGAVQRRLRLQRRAG